LESGGEPLKDSQEELMDLHDTSTVAPQPWARRVWMVEAFTFR